MVRACGAALAVVSLLGRMVLGVVGVAVVIGLLAGPAEPDHRSRPAKGNDDERETRVALAVLEDGPARTLVIVDASGRELAALTRWLDGQIAVVMGRDNVGSRLSFWLGIKGDTRLLLRSSSREVRVDSEPSGELTTNVRDVAGALAPSEP